MKKSIAALGLVTLVAGLLSGCAPTTKIVANTVISVGQDALASSLNAGVLADSQVTESNGYINELTQASFFDLDSTGKLVANEKFGHVEVVKSTATELQISYTIRRNVTWSDGVPVSAADLLVSWAAATDPADAGFASSLSNTGLVKATASPIVGVNGRRLYLTFSQSVADWKTALKLTVPAHVLAAKAFGNQASAADAKAKITEVLLGDDSDSLKKVAEAYNSAFSLTAGAFDVAAYPTSGSYVVESASQANLVLKARTDCFWCRPATVETVNLNFYDGGARLIDAIKAGEVDLAEAVDNSQLPLASVAAEIKALDTAGYKYSTMQSGKITAVILNYGKGSLFDGKTVYKEETSSKLIEALLAMIPRQRIVDALSLPIKLTRSDSFVYLSTQQDYSAVTQQNGSANYRIQNAEHAKELLKKVKINGRNSIGVLFDAKDLNAQIAFNLINQYASDARLKLANVSTDNVAEALKKGNHEVYITTVDSLSLSASAIGRLQNSSSTKSSESLNSLISKIGENPDAADVNQTYADLDKELFNSAYGLPLYELPKIVIFSSKLKGYSTPFGANSAVSNFELWNVAPEKQQ